MLQLQLYYLPKTIYLYLNKKNTAAVEGEDIVVDIKYTESE